ncbi:DUF1292 domain-containing protein [Clostridium sp.]|uniref:DUF1292 domain-containing protein n=1 Tax=Clostridium sp. TaxID=1506 RepID=UPI003D6D778E
MKAIETITVVNEFGKNVVLELIDAVKVDGREYVIVGPKDSDEAYAYKSVVKGGETEYSSVGVGPEFKKVLDEYNKHQK